MLPQSAVAGPATLARDIDHRARGAGDIGDVPDRRRHKVSTGAAPHGGSGGSL